MSGSKDSLWRSRRNNLAFKTILGSSRLLQLLPARAREAASRPFGAFIHVVMAHRIGKVDAEYAQVVQSSALDYNQNARRRPAGVLYRNLSRLIIDAFWLMHASPSAISRVFPSAEVDLAPLASANKKGGVILAFPHLGSIGALIGLSGKRALPVTLVARYAPGSVIGRLLKHYCERCGIELVPLNPSTAGGATGACLDALRRGRILAIAGDWYMGRNRANAGVEVRIAGLRTTIGKGPAHLALGANVPIVCGAVYQHGSKRTIQLRPPIDPQRFGRARRSDSICALHCVLPMR